MLSGDRLLVGVWVGYVEAALAALGASVADRGRRTDEHLAAMLALWDEPTPAFAGQFVSFSGVVERARPVQRPPPADRVRRPRPRRAPPPRSAAPVAALTGGSAVD